MFTSITMETIHDDILRLGIKTIELQYLDPVGGVHCNILNATKLKKDAHGSYILVPNDIEATLDGSSIPGFQNIDKTGLEIVPGPQPRIYLDPTNPTRLVVMGNTKEPNGPLYPKDPRNQAILAEQWLSEQTDLGLKAMRVGPEFEFFVFPVGVDPLALQADNAAYHCSAADNPSQDFMEEYMLALQDAGVDSRFFHSEVATHQQEIGVNCETLLRAADNVIIQREILKKLAKKHGVTVSWEPKLLDAYRETIKQTGKPDPINGSGLHTNLSFDTDMGANAFVKYDAYGRPLTNELSDKALLCIAGVLKHANSLQAFFNPSTISGARLGMGESPKFIVAGHDNRSALIRIVTVPVGQEFKTRIEVRAPDSMTCPHTWFSAVQMAMVDAMRQGMSMPREAWVLHHLEPQIIDTNFYKMSEARRLELSIPELHIGLSILRESLSSLAGDHHYLLARNSPFGESFDAVLAPYCKTVQKEDIAREQRRDAKNAAWISAHSASPQATPQLSPGATPSYARSRYSLLRKNEATGFVSSFSDEEEHVTNMKASTIS
jgi:glutamine synthetase